MNLEFKIKKIVVGSLLTNCYLLFSQKKAIIIDPGGEPERVLGEVRKEKARLKYIVNTHYHPDHIAGNNFLKEKTNAFILIGKAEEGFIKFKSDRFLKGGDRIKAGNINLKVLSTPGHTKGSISLLQDSFVFVGDLLFKDGIGRTDLPGGSEKDMKNSLKKLFKILKPGTKVYPGHGDDFVVEKEGLNLENLFS